MKKILNKIFKALHNPKLIFASMLLGGLIGVFAKDLAAILAPVGKLYMSLLTMVITPLLVVSISSSISSLLKNHLLRGSIERILFLFPIVMLSAAGIGLLVAVIGQPGSNLSLEAQESIGKLLANAPSAVTDVSKDTGLWSLFKLMIPGNIFSAMTQGNNLAVLFFSLLLGVGIGMVEEDESHQTISLLNVLYKALAKVIGGIMAGLPIGLLCLFADHISHIGPGILLATWKYVLLLFIGTGLITVLSWVYLKRKLQYSWKEMYLFLKEPSIVALATASSLASIPSLLAAFETKTKISKDSVQLFVPLSVCLNAVGSSFIVSLTAIFMMEVYGVAITGSSVVVVILGSVLTAIAMSGAPGIGALAMFGIIMKPLGIPLEPTIVLMLAVMPIIEGMITLSNVAANTASISYLAMEEEGQSGRENSFELVAGQGVISLVNRQVEASELSLPNK